MNYASDEPNSYVPIQSGSRKHDSIVYEEYSPAKSLKRVVSCYWHLSSAKVLPEAFTYTVMPDACIDIVFSLHNQDKPIIMAPHTSIEEIDLGKSFSYVGIRLLPGTLSTKFYKPTEIIGRQIEVTPMVSKHVTEAAKMLRYTTSDVRKVLDELCLELSKGDVFIFNELVQNAISGLRYGVTFSDVSKKMGYSDRHLRRLIKEHTGFNPGELRRVLRFQQVLSSSDDALIRFADEAHLIKEFQRITGLTFRQFTKTFIT